MLTVNPPEHKYFDEANEGALPRIPSLRHFWVYFAYINSRQLKILKDTMEMLMYWVFSLLGNQVHLLWMSFTGISWAIPNASKGTKQATVKKKKKHRGKTLKWYQSIKEIAHSSWLGISKLRKECISSDIFAFCIFVPF